jgi:TatD DNase family protein
MLIDTHAHLFLEQFDEDIDLVIQRAQKEEVECVLMPNIDEETIPQLKSTYERSPLFFRKMMGLHPTSVKSDWENQLELIRKELYENQHEYIAVGEIGVDLYWDTKLKSEQEAVFREQLRWAKDLDKPVAIHVRESFEEVLTIVAEENDDSLKGVFHCFTGTVDHAFQIQEFEGFYLGIGGVLTFKNSGLDSTLLNLPIELMVLETDSPFLAPTPFRGKRNESSYISYVAERLAEVKDLPLAEIARITTQNARELFKLN